MTTALIKRPEPPQPDCDREHVDRMWKLFLRCNATRQPDADGAYIIVDEIGETRLEDQRLHRDMPYSICKGAENNAMTDSRKPINYVLDWMRANKVPLTKENYLHINYLGQDVPEEPLDGELEAEIPREILAAELRAIRRADQKFLRAVGIGYGGRS